MTNLTGTPVSSGHILTAAEAAQVLRCDVTDPLMLALLPSVDTYIRIATGRDWTLDVPIYDEAKSAARILITLWHENPAMTGYVGNLPAGLSACLCQLEAQALTLGTTGVPEEALTLAASMPADGQTDVALDASLVLVFSHQVAAGATAAVTLKDADGNAVATTNALDVTGKILTVNPNADLALGTRYTIVLAAVPDIYGQTLTSEIAFWAVDA